MTHKRPKIVMRGNVGIRLDILQPEHLEHFKKRLTLKSIPYKDNAPITVRSYYEEDGYFWVPRYFDHLTYWPEIKDWEWVAPPLDYTLAQLMKPLPERKQPEAIDALEAALRRDSGALGVLPTGIGKTLIALSVARRFQTPIAILVYAGHMIDNWVEHAGSVLGIPPEDVGLVKEGRCDLGKPLTIVSIQTVMSRDLPQALYDQIGFIVADEIHRYGARAWGKVVGNFPARYRLGMSADPVRDDGLDPIIRWNFGKVGYCIHKRPTGELPTVCLIRYPAEYSDRKYVDWKKIRLKSGGEKWVPGSPNSMKYDKLLMRDQWRNGWLVDKIVEARAAGRAIIVFARQRDHIKDLHDRFIVNYGRLRTETDYPETRSMLLWGGIKDKERKSASTADVIFTTHSYAREALNLTHLDTLIFATPTGDPLQAAGRLRDKGTEGRKSLLIIDPFEGNDYSFRKAMKRKTAYENLGMTVKRLTRKTR